jgi:hypothetical protein
MTKVFIAAAPRSTWVHLSRDPRPDLERSTLCGLRASDEAPAQWFALAGCTDCARIALRRGVDHVTDIDGAEVPLVAAADRS